jgi:hypothetical protein
MAQRYVFSGRDSSSIAGIVERNKDFFPPMPDFAELLKQYVSRATGRETC